MKYKIVVGLVLLFLLLFIFSKSIKTDDVKNNDLVTTDNQGKSGDLDNSSFDYTPLDELGLEFEDNDLDEFQDDLDNFDY